MEIRRGTLEVSNQGEQKIRFGEFITPEEFGNLQKDIARLELFNSHRELYSIFIINFIELSEYFQDVTDDLTKKSITSLRNTTPEFRLIYRNANRLLFNLLTSGRTLIDHQETFLKKEYGKDSQEIKDFKSIASDIFDSSFEYRFTYKLRNYAQHCGFPISSFKFSSNNKRLGNLINIKTNFNPLFVKEELLSKFDGWGSIVKNDIRNQPDEFPVMWTISIYYKGMKIINNEFERIELSKLSKRFLGLKEFMKKFGDLPENTDPCIFYDFKYSKPDSLENSTFSNLIIPFDLINEIDEKIKAAYMQ
jgi:hypothetical protein